MGLWLARPSVSAPVMKAISCSYFGAAESVSLTRVSVPQMFSDSDILIRIRAASFHRLDEQITRGYGRTLRRMISNSPEIPLVLGRAAAGVVEAVGRDCRSGLEIGDEVKAIPSQDGFLDNSRTIAGMAGGSLVCSRGGCRGGCGARKSRGKETLHHGFRGSCQPPLQWLRGDGGTQAG